MIPGKLDITIYRGGTFGLTITAEDGDGDAIDFADYSVARMHIRTGWVHQASESLPVLALSSTGATSADGNLEIDSTNLHININSTATAALVINQGTYDIELIKTIPDPDVVDKLLYGKIVIIGEITSGDIAYAE